MNWVSCRQLCDDVAAFANVLAVHPTFNDIVAVVGVSVSGCLPASMLAMIGGLPFSCVDNFVASGRLETPPHGLAEPVPACGRVLILADGVGQENLIATVVAKVRSSGLCNKSKIVRGAMYASGDAVQTKQVDVFFRQLDSPRVFEWNLFGHTDARKWAFSFESLRAGDRIPKHEAAAVVCDIPETLRKRTAGALAKAGVRYRELVMPDVRAANWSEDERSEWKGKWYRQSECELFVEMKAEPAMAIAELSGKPVVCWENKRMYQKK